MDPVTDTPSTSEVPIGDQLADMNKDAHARHAEASKKPPRSNKSNKQQRRNKKPPQDGVRQALTIEQVRADAIRLATEAATRQVNESMMEGLGALEARIDELATTVAHTNDRVEHLYSKQVLQQLGSLRAAVTAVQTKVRESIDDTELLEKVDELATGLENLEESLKPKEKTPAELLGWAFAGLIAKA